MRLDAVFPPMVTVFDRAGEIDAPAISRNVAQWIQAGVGGVVALGSNGEAPFVEEDEAERVIAAARDSVPRGSGAPRRHRPGIDEGDDCGIGARGGTRR